MQVRKCICHLDKVTFALTSPLPPSLCTRDDFSQVQLSCEPVELFICSPHYSLREYSKACFRMLPVGGTTHQAKPSLLRASHFRPYREETVSALKVSSTGNDPILSANHVLGRLGSDRGFLMGQDNFVLC